MKKNETVRDVEKARAMAEAEDPEREFLTEFKRYCADPVAYRKEERAMTEQKESEGFLAHTNADDFMYLVQEGVTAKDLEDLAIAAGEFAGQAHDSEKLFEEKL